MLGIISKTWFGKKWSLNPSDVTTQVTKYPKLLPNAMHLAKRHFRQAQEVLRYSTFNRYQTVSLECKIIKWALGEGEGNLKYISIRHLWITFKGHKKLCLSRTTNQSFQSWNWDKMVISKPTIDKIMKHDR